MLQCEMSRRSPKALNDDGADPMMASSEGLKIEGFEIEAIGRITPDQYHSRLYVC